MTKAVPAALIASATLAGDQLIKYILVNRDIFISTPLKGISLGISVNRGIAFSIPFPVTLLILLSIVIILGVVLWWFTIPTKTTAAVLGIGFFVGGSTSNLLDRSFHGGVLDYFNIGTGSFNLADSAIILGILLLLLSHHHLAKSA